MRLRCRWIGFRKETYDHNCSDKVLTRLAREYEANELREDARQVLQMGIRNGGGDKAKRELAMSYQRDRKWDDAIQYWKMIKMEDESDASDLADAYVAKEDIEAALDVLVSVYEKQEENPYRSAHKTYLSHQLERLLERHYLKGYTKEKGRGIWKRLAKAGGILAKSGDCEETRSTNLICKKAYAAGELARGYQMLDRGGPR